MGLDQFFGNERIASALRGMLRRNRVPSALLFTGPRGIGKYTLARMFAQAANCERLTDDFCGECDSCRRMARLADPTPLIEAGLVERGESADAAMVERTPLIIETHPGCMADRPRSGASAHTRCAADDAGGAVASGAARRILQAAGAAARVHSRWRGHNALDRCGRVPENPRGAAGIRDDHPARAHARFPAANHSLALPAISLRACACRAESRNF